MSEPCTAPSEVDPLMDTQQTAEYIHHSPRTLIRWRVERKGPPIIKAGRKVFYRKSDLDAWLDSHRLEMVREAAA